MHARLLAHRAVPLSSLSYFLHIAPCSRYWLVFPIPAAQHPTWPLFARSKHLLRVGPSSPRQRPPPRSLRAGTLHRPLPHDVCGWRSRLNPSDPRPRPTLHRARRAPSGKTFQGGEWGRTLVNVVAVLAALATFDANVLVGGRGCWQCPCPTKALDVCQQCGRGHHAGPFCRPAAVRFVAPEREPRGKRGSGGSSGGGCGGAVGEGLIVGAAIRRQVTPPQHWKKIKEGGGPLAG